jgi:hypothetical protein
VSRGIPTTYAGITFRSRHEATWAHLFDQLGLRWEYEPCDLDGYIPDFDVLFGARPLLIEVKPHRDEIEEAKAKILRAGWTGDIAIVVNGETPRIGEFHEDGVGWDAAILTFCLACKKATIVSEGGRWRCRNCLADSRELWWAYTAQEEWRMAKEFTQWRPAAE